MKNICRKIFTACCALILILASSCDFRNRVGPDFVIVYPETSDEALINPGKGWILYDDSQGSFMAQSDLAWSYATLGYARFRWADIEKADKEYDWSTVDFALNQCKAMGKTFALGVMASDPTSTLDFCTPEFIHQMSDVNSLVLSVPNYALPDSQNPGQYTKMKKHEIDFTDPGEGYYRKVREFADALAERYGGDPWIEYIDIRPFGSWGENTHAWLYGSGEEGYDKGICDDRRHDQGVVNEVMIRLWDAYLQAFSGTGTQLMTAWGYGCNGCMSFTNKEPFYWAAEHGIGIRRDGYSTRTSCAGSETLWSLNKAPSALEMPSSYVWQVKNTGYGAADLLVSPELNRASYYPIGTYGRDSATMLNQIRDAVDAVTNRIGYHFVLTEVSFPETLGIGVEAPISMKWLNDGTTKIFRPAYTAAALLDSEGKVEDICWLDRTDPRDWVCAMDIMAQDRTNQETDTLLFKNADPSKEYSLAIGLFTSKEKTSPDILIGNTGKTADNWYVIYGKDMRGEKVTDLTAGTGVTVTASSWMEGYEPSGALQFSDGYWTSDANGQEAWLQLDLGSVQTVSGLDIRWGMHYAGQFSVHTAESGNGPYTKVYDTHTDTGTGTEETQAPVSNIGFDEVKARYVKIVCTEPAVQGPGADELVPMQGRNLLEDPYFRNGLKAWRDYDPESTQVVTDPLVPGTGNKSLEFSGKTFYSIRQSLTQMLELTGPGEYVISMEAMAEQEGAVIDLELGVKGSEHDKAAIPFWDAQTKYRYTSGELSTDGSSTVEFPVTVEYGGLIELGYLRIAAVCQGETTVRIRNVSLVKKSEISGERKSLFTPDEGLFTILSLRVN